MTNEGGFTTSYGVLEGRGSPYGDSVLKGVTGHSSAYLNQEGGKTGFREFSVTI